MTTKIIGIGDAGCEFVFWMHRLNRKQSYETIAFNTYPQYQPSMSVADSFYLLGDGGGTGGNPMVGRQIGEANKDLFFNLLNGADRLILTAGMGGGLGTGASHVIAYVAREMRIPCVAVVSMPFDFEGTQRQQLAQLGVKSIEKFTEQVIALDATFIAQQAEASHQSRFVNLSIAMSDYYATLKQAVIQQIRLHLNANSL
ncbi:MAG: hypothetical protein AAF846_21805 [Chloroflexota bacterium]